MPERAESFTRWGYIRKSLLLAELAEFPRYLDSLSRPKSPLTKANQLLFTEHKLMIFIYLQEKLLLTKDGCSKTKAAVAAAQ